MASQIRPSFARPLKIFISYARVDSKYREELSNHLATLVKNGDIELFEDSQLHAGSNWETEIDRLLNAAEIVLSLVSANYFSSSYCLKELNRALERSKSEEILLIPIVIRAVEWTATELHRFQALPAGGKPVSTWPDTDEAYQSISMGIRALIEKHTLAAPQPVGPKPAPAPSKAPARGTGAGAAAAPQKSLAATYEAYDYENPATRFFRGRQKEIDRLCNTIRSGKSSAVFGLQRAGKTSLVDKALEKVAPLNPVVVNIDMSVLWPSFQRVLDFFYVVVSELAKAENKDPLTLQAPLNEAYSSAYGVYDLQNKFRGILRQSRKITGRPLVVFIDEFQDVELAFQQARRKDTHMGFDAGLMRWLGQLLKEKEDILQLLLCCRYHATDLEQRERMELFKLIDLIPLEPLDESSARLLIRDPVAGAIHYDDEAMRRLLELSGGFPYLIQYFCHELVRGLRGPQRDRVRRKDVDDCAAEIAGSDMSEPKFRVLYEDYERLNGGRPWKVMLCIAALAKEERQRVPFRDLAAYCRGHAGLPDQDLLRKIISSLTAPKLILEDRLSPEPSYRFGPELLRRWLRESGRTQEVR